MEKEESGTNSRNKLPQDRRLAPTLTTFESRLKKVMFTFAFRSIIMQIIISKYIMFAFSLCFIHEDTVSALRLFLLKDIFLLFPMVKCVTYFPSKILCNPVKELVS